MVINLELELKELYYYETDQERLDFDSDPVYQEKMERALAELETEELSPALFSLLDTANQISFTHGVRLGLRLGLWAKEGRRGAQCTPTFPKPSRKRRAHAVRPYIGHVGAGLCAGPGQSLSLRGPRSGPWQSALPALRIPTAPSGPRNDGTRRYSKSSFPNASKARLDSSAFLFRLPLTR